MQPYFFPYIGYFQLIGAVDLFIVYDNIKYTKKGWINRNRMLRNGKDVMFTLPLKSGSDSMDICERNLGANFNCGKLLNQIREAYRRAPYFDRTFPLVEKIVRYEDANLFRFLHNSIVATCQYLGLVTEIRPSSEINIDQELKNQDKVLALCDAVGARSYINAVGGFGLYSEEVFRNRGIELRFIRPGSFEYAQFDHPFVPWLSIVDGMMFNSLATLKDCINANYELI